MRTKRNLLQVYLLGAVAFLPVVVQAQFIFMTNSGTITITRYTGSSAVVVIPSTITGLPVTSVAELAFFGTSSLTNVTIPGSITNFGQLAFRNCINLATITVDTNNPVYTSVDGILFDKSQSTLVQYPEGKTGSNYTISTSVTGIGPGAFFQCTGLTNVTIPGSVTTISDSSFSRCTGLVSLTIPNSVTSIGFDAFANCTSLTNVTILDSATRIGQQSFFGCSGLSEVSFGTNVSSIGIDAFGYCTSLTDITIPDSVTSVGFEAFLNCTRLTNVTIGNGVTDLGGNAFYNCTALIHVAIGSSVTNIEDSAFSYCFSLASVTIPDGVISIGNYTFKYCSSLNRVTIPGSVTNLGYSVFEFCLSLEAVTVDIDNPVFSSLDGVLFDKGQSRLIQYPEGRAGSCYTVPNGVTSIASTAFAFCFDLTSVIIPNCVTNIENLAFYDCVNLTNLYCRGDAPGVGDYVFNLDDNTTVYYLPATTGWGATLGGRPTILWNPQPLISNASVSMQTDQFGFTISGNSGLIIVVEACTNLLNPVWQAVQTNTLSGDSSFFSDPQWTNYPARFYRLRSP